MCKAPRTCKCGHSEYTHVFDREVCLNPDCFCLRFKEKSNA